MHHLNDLTNISLTDIQCLETQFHCVRCRKEKVSRLNPHNTKAEQDYNTHSCGAPWLKWKQLSRFQSQAFQPLWEAKVSKRKPLLRKMNKTCLRACNDLKLFRGEFCAPIKGKMLRNFVLCIYMMLAYRTATGSAPTYFHSLLRIYIPSRSLRSASERHLVVPSQRGSKSLSRTFSFTVPGWWNDLPTPIRNAGSLSIFKQQLKTHLFQLYLTTYIFFFTFSKSSSFSLSFSPSLASLYLFEQCLRLSVIGTSSVCLPLQD